MNERKWRAIAVGEFIILSAAICFTLFYFGYKTGFLDEGARGVLQVMANIGYLVFFLVGSTGWMMIIGLWGWIDEWD